MGLFLLLGQADFRGSGVGEIRLGSSGGDSIIQGDINGDGIADFEILVEDVFASAFTTDDFIGVI